MTAPALLFSLLVAVAAASLYHLLFGNSLRQLGLFVVASLAGFAVGQALPIALSLPHLGPIHIIQGLVAALVAMTIVKLAGL
jgi:hypothetical protein